MCCFTIKNGSVDQCVMGRCDRPDGEGMRDSHHPRAHSFPSEMYVDSLNDYSLSAVD